MNRCGQLIPWAKSGKFICNVRVCPACAEANSRRLVWNIMSCAIRLHNPALAVVSLHSRGPDDLKSTIDYWKSCLRKLKDRKCMKMVPSGVWVIETLAKWKWHKGRKCRILIGWNVHGHFLIDVGEGFEESKVNTAWKQLTAGRGTFKLSKNSKVGKSGLINHAEYATKPRTRCPPPFITTNDELQRESLKRLEILIHSGLRRMLLRSVGMIYLNQSSSHVPHHNLLDQIM